MDLVERLRVEESPVVPCGQRRSREDFAAEGVASKLTNCVGDVRRELAIPHRDVHLPPKGFLIEDHSPALAAGAHLVRGPTSGKLQFSISYPLILDASATAVSIISRQTSCTGL